MSRVLTRRELNRSLLQRQYLLDRADASVMEVLANVCGLQSQAPEPPYIGLWSRIGAFDPSELGQLLLDRRAVRLPLMRSTIHLVASDDAWPLRMLVQPAIDRLLSAGYSRQLAGIEQRELVRRATAFLAGEPATLGALGEALEESFPGVESQALSNAARAWIPLVQPPPRGLWKTSGAARHTPLSVWLGRPPEETPGLDWLVARYLTAYGPATVQDIQAWSGLVRLGSVVLDMGDRLTTCQDEKGRTLLDLAHLAVADPDTPAPVRFLPEWETAIIGFQDRDRILSPELMPRVYTKNGIYQPVVLIDGFVATIWKLKKQKRTAHLGIDLFQLPSSSEKQEIEQEGSRLLDFLEPDSHQSIEISCDS